MGKAAKQWSESKDYPNGLCERIEVEQCTYGGKTVYIVCKSQSGPKKADDGEKGWDYDSDMDDYFYKKKKYISDENPLGAEKNLIEALGKYMRG